MAKTFISTDPETKEQRTVKIPEGCIVFEMNAKEMKKFVMETFAGFLFVDERERLQVFPREVKTYDEIWQYVYPIRQGVAAIMVNEEKMNTLLEYRYQKKIKEDKEKLYSEDIRKRGQMLREAAICNTVASGILQRFVIEDYYTYKRNNAKIPTKNPENTNIVYTTLDNYSIDVYSLKKKPSNARNNRDAEKEILGHVFLSEKDNRLLLQHSTNMVKYLLSIPPIECDNQQYKDGVEKIEIDCLQLLIDNYKVLGDEGGLIETAYKCIKGTSFSLKRKAYSALMDYFLHKDDEENLIKIAQEAYLLYPEDVYSRLITYYRQLDNRGQELKYIENYLRVVNPSHKMYNKRRAELLK